VKQAETFPSWARGVSLILLLALVPACANVSTSGVRRYSGMRLPVPRAIVVYDFEPTGSAIGIDPGAGASEGGSGLSSAELAVRREVGRVLADVLAKELQDRGIVTARQQGPVNVPPESMAIRGQIISIDEGSSARRIFIGFGSGRSRLASVAELLGNADAGMVSLWRYQNTAASGARPGVLTTLPIGIAVQGVTLLVLAVNGTLTTMGALSSTSSANAKRMAKEMADAVEESLSRITLGH
jgi:hypothetical protein